MSDRPTIPAELSPRDSPINAERQANSNHWWLRIAIGLVALLALYLYFR